MSKSFFIFLFVLIYASCISFSQNLTSPTPEVSQSVYNDTSPPLSEIDEAPLYPTPWKDGIIPLLSNNPQFQDQYETDPGLQISDGNNDMIHHQCYSLNSKNILIRAITNTLNSLLEKKNILSLSFTSLTIFDFKRTERTYQKLNNDIDKLFDKLEITNLSATRYHYKKTVFFNYPILKDMDKKLDTIISRKNPH